MNRKPFALFPLILLLIIPFTALAQDIGPADTGATSVLSKPIESRDLKAIIYRQRADALAGYITDITRDTIILMSGSRREMIGLDEVSAINILPGRKKTPILSFCALSGLYLGNLAFYRAEQQPSSYYASDPDDNSLGELFANILFAGAGVGVGFLLSTGMEKELLVNFAGSDWKRQDNLQRLSVMLNRNRRSRPVHLSVGGSWIFTRNTSIAGDTWIGESTKLNLFRRLQLTCSIKPNLQFGLALINQNEPTKRGSKDSWALRQSFSSTGYYFIGRFDLNKSASSQRTLKCFAGAGIGVVVVNFRHAAEKWDYQLGHLLYRRIVKKNPLSGYVFAGTDVFFMEALSLSFITDFAFARSYYADGIPEVGLDRQKVCVGNPSIGFSLGIHM